jgi:hypothetical protein
MRRNVLVVLIAVAVLALTGIALGQASPAKGSIHTPPSTLGIPGLPRTPLYVFIPEGGAQPAIPLGETPASIACIYGVTAKTAGCDDHRCEYFLQHLRAASSERDPGMR